jgi:hypothetical protein
VDTGLEEELGCAERLYGGSSACFAKVEHYFSNVLAGHVSVGIST